MGDISIIGAAEHNLKNIDLRIPRGKLTVITGVSGSGKSSLIRDVLQREGQRMYLETFSAYTRAKLGKVRPAHVKNIAGLMPVLSVGQTHVQANRRSTAGTFSDVLPFLRQLFSRYNDQGLLLSRNQFSFNTEQGWCYHCKGLGIEEYIDSDKIIDDSDKSLRAGTLKITLPNGYTIYSQVTIEELNKVCRAHGFDVDTPWKQLNADQQHVVLYGSQKVKVLYGKHSLESRMKWSGMTAKPRDEGFYKGIIPVMEEILQRDRNDNILKFVSWRKCPVCEGTRLNKTARRVTWHKNSWAFYENLSFSELHRTICEIRNTERGEQALVNNLKARLKQLVTLSVGHIAPARLSETLSQGELRRMRLAQLNYNGLTGVLYLFDEPSIGLHPRDVHTLIETMYRLVNHGNTVVVVEHNESVIRSAQSLIELGPGAGREGGNLVFSGTPAQLMQNKVKESPTAKSLTDKPNFKKNGHDANLVETFDIAINKAHNIENQKFTFARNRLNVITGVSGAGKSTLVHFGLLDNTEFDEVIFVDQKPVGRTSRSNPATYTGLFDELRKLFAQTPIAKQKGLKPGDFSFNNKNGQCQACGGSGTLTTGMHIFEDLVQPCPVCKGARYNNRILEVHYHGRSIDDVLQMDVQAALAFFEDLPRIKTHLQILKDLGLGYLQLGQPSTTLSGGEAQRIKLAKNLYQKHRGELLYILDEPTTGLHASDIRLLMGALSGFIKNGHTLVIVEHDEQVVRQADWIVDLGPEGGSNGGQCLFCGPVDKFLAENNSPTQKALKKTKELILRVEKPVDLPAIKLHDITTNNLKHINLEVPVNQILAITGRSGSGKTSLLMDTLHSKGQHIFTENLSGYRRLQMKFGLAAKVGEVHSITPTVAVGAGLHKPDIKATVASASGLYDLLRLLFARFAHHPEGKQASAADFSVSNEFSVCEACEGTGLRKVCDEAQVIVNPNLPLFEGALGEHKTVVYFTSAQNKYRWLLKAMATGNSININQTWSKLTKSEQNKILYGTGQQEYVASWPYKRKNNRGVYEFSGQWLGLCHLIEAEYRNHFPSKRGKAAMELLMDVHCEKCKGYRLNEAMLEYKFGDYHMGQMMTLTISKLLSATKLPVYKQVSEALLQQIKEKLQFLIGAGLGNLPLGRPAAWLSTGERKWIRLSSLLSASLSGMCIILDEPSFGLDNHGRYHLAKALEKARLRSNTIIFSDHYPEMLETADRIVEIGPGSGKAGGEIVQDITNEDGLSEIISKKSSALQVKQIRQLKPRHDLLKISGIAQPLYHHAMNCITGPMGSGKTRLILHISTVLEQAKDSSVVYAEGNVSSNPARSSIATRSNILNDLKMAFSKTIDAQKNGLKAADFGFNNKKYQCTKCKGLGRVKTSLDFLPDVTEVCPECDGTRYKPEILHYTFEGEHIAQWLSKTLHDLDKAGFWSVKSGTFIDFAKAVNLEYLTGNRDFASLSAGEKQRLSIVEKLIDVGNKPSVILFDNPTEGLDPENVMQIIRFFDGLIKKGHTVIVADNNPLISYNAEQVIKL